MVDEVLVAPLRAESLFDVSTGNITIRFATYLDNLATTINDVVVTTEGTEGFFSEVQQVTALTAELMKNIDEVDQLSTLVANANATIAEMQKQIDELDSVIGINDKADIAALTKRIQELEALVE